MTQEIKKLHDVQFEHHIDGLWNTTRFSIGEDIVIVKSRQGKGVKFHIMESEKVVKTYRFNKLPFDDLETIIIKYYNKWNETKPQKSED